MNSKLKQLLSDTKHLEKMTEAFDKANQAKTNYGDDDRYWKPETDKAGNGYAIIRFLPVAEADITSLSVPYVPIYTHGFKGPTGKWYIEKSRTTLNEPDPVSEYNTKLWNSGQQDEARKQKRKLGYVANILVIKDEKHPENEGKVFLFSFGPKIMKKIDEALKPPFSDQTRFNPFHFLEGANFKLRIRKGDGGYRNYDSSEFEAPSKLFGGDEKKIEALWNSQHSLSELIHPSKFKSYAELKRKLESVLGTVEVSESSVSDEDNDEIAPWEKSNKPQSTTTTNRTLIVTDDAAAAASDDDDDLEMFKKLASS